MRTFPVSLADFFSTIGQVEVTMDLGESLESVGMLGGDTLSVDYGPRLWRGKVTTRMYPHVAINEAKGLVNLLRQGGSTFFVTESHVSGPADDPDGSILGASTPTIDSIVNPRELRVVDFPVSYTLSRNDKLAWSYGTGRYALHEIVDTEVTGGTGNARVEVVPYIRDDPTGAAITVLSPACLAMMVPETYEPPIHHPDGSRGFSFEWIQVKP